MIIQLAGGTQGDREKQLELSVAFPPTALSESGRKRNARSSHLVRQGEHFIPREGFGRMIERKRETMAAQPDF